jgi:hypothetical protein
MLILLSIVRVAHEIITEAMKLRRELRRRYRVIEE